MAKRTLASKYEAYDAALSVQRQILCYSKDAKEIYYDVDPIEDQPVPSPVTSGGGEAPSATSSAPTVLSAPIAAAPSSGPAAQIPDAPVSAIDIVRSLVAQKLKKPLADIPLTKAIKDLVGGELLNTLGY
jgi:fatty acid synthase subunit alpha